MDAHAQNAFSFSITTFDGQQHSLGQYQGKRVLLVVIPSTYTSSDSDFLRNMDTVAMDYQDSITVIGIPSYEDGYYDDSLYSLKAYYGDLVLSPCIIAEGMDTRKASAYQDPLFGWLTNQSQNGHFDEDVKGVGEMYFIDPQGNLYGVFGPEQALNGALMEQMMQMH